MGQNHSSEPTDATPSHPPAAVDEVAGQGTSILSHQDIVGTPASSKDEPDTASQELPFDQPCPHGAPARTLIGTVFLIGTLLALPGSLLPVWGYHRLDAFVSAGHHFLALAAGFVIANLLASLCTARYPRAVFSPLPGSVFALLAILIFTFLPPPFPLAFQLSGAFCAGVAIGMLNATLFHQIGSLYQLRSANTFHLASVSCLLGVLTTPLLVSFAVEPSRTMALLALAISPLFVGLSVGFRAQRTLPVERVRSFREALADFRNPTAILLSLLLLFQLGNEMALLGWLPVFLIQRLGVSPATGLFGLVAFALALLLGRVGVQAMAHHAWRHRLILSGLLVALLGCLMLAFTNNLFGALFGITLTGVGFAPIYPATQAIIHGRFPYFHPAIFNSMFSIGMVGGILAPWTLGWLTHNFGIQYVMIVPLAGLLMVSIIMALLWLERKLVGVNS